MSFYSRIRSLISDYVSVGHSRSVAAKRNILGLTILKAVSLIINFLLVPLTLTYLNPTKYGIWLTLSSIISWVGVMDFGLGNGLRNRFAESIANNDHARAKKYVSTTYFFVSIIVLGTILLFLFINPLLQWTKILNTPVELAGELTWLAVIVFVFFSLRLVFGLVATLLVADQKPAAANLIEVATNLCSLVAIFILTRVSSGSLILLGFSISFFMMFVPLIANIWCFAGRYRDFRPSFRFIDRAYWRDLLGLGLKFFFLQLAGVLIFSTSNIIITQYFGPGEVTPFNIAFRYYGFASMAFVVVLTPFWTAYTDAYTRGDIDWIRRATRKLVKMWGWLAVGVFFMTIAANSVYSIWVGNGIVVPTSLSVLMGVYVLIIAWSNIFAYFMNGIGKIRLQLWLASIISVLNIPVSIFFAKNLNMGIPGIILATCICLFPPCLIWPLQMKKILRNEAAGIWNK